MAAGSCASCPLAALCSLAWCRTIDDRAYALHRLRAPAFDRPCMSCHCGLPQTKLAARCPFVVLPPS